MTLTRIDTETLAETVEVGADIIAHATAACDRALTVGRKYTVLGVSRGVFEGNRYVTVRDDNGRSSTFSMSRFTLEVDGPTSTYAANKARIASLNSLINRQQQTVAQLRKVNAATDKEREFDNVHHALKSIGMSCKYDADTNKIKIYNSLTPGSFNDSEHSSVHKTSLVWSSCSSEMLRRLSNKMVAMEDKLNG